MRIEVICTGDELLTGLTTDTNSPYFMGKLFALGEQIAHVQIVPDDRAAIRSALESAARRADAVLVSGGLGPTADDLTAECAAEAAGVKLVTHEETLRKIQARFAQRRMAFTPNNARQAQVPEGAEVVANEVGSAPMFIQRVGRCTLFYVPGVPREYRHLVDHSVLPRLSEMIARQPDRIFRASRLLKTVGLPESHLDAKMAPLARLHPKVTFGYRTHAPENHLKLLAEGESQAQADKALRLAEEAARELLGERLFGIGDASLASSLVNALRERRETVAVAESLTGGWVAHLIVSEQGAGDVFLGGLIPYDLPLKTQLLGVEPKRIEETQAVAPDVALQMARAARQMLGATYGLSTTGFAGPAGGTETEPVGTVYVGLAGPGIEKVERHVFQGDRRGDREWVRRFAAAQALDLLRTHLLNSATT